MGPFPESELHISDGKDFGYSFKKCKFLQCELHANKEINVLFIIISTQKLELLAAICVRVSDTVGILATGKIQKSV